MKNIDSLFSFNKEWQQAKKHQQPDFFEQLSKTQKPEFLWIGCCDSRVPPEVITKSEPGDMLVHSNIANQVLPSDTNSQAILQFALTVLNIRKVIVAGHTHCGGVCAAMQKEGAGGKMGDWLKPLRQLYHDNHALIDQKESDNERINTLCQLNIKEQVNNIAQTDIAKRLWQQNEPLSIFGVIYDIEKGELKDMNYCINSLQ